MSLEAALIAATEAVKALTEALQATPSKAQKEAESMASFKKEQTPNAQAESSTPPSGEPSQPIQESSTPALDYAKDVKPITLKLSKEKGREETISVLSRFGVKGAQELDPAQWTDYIELCNKVLAGEQV